MSLRKPVQAIIMAAALVILTSCTTGSLPQTSNRLSTPLNTAEETQVTTETATATAGTVAEIMLYPAALDLPVGRSVGLKIDFEGNQAIKWTSSNTDVVSVSPDGIVSALATGEALITAAAGSSSDVCRITVTKKGATLAYLLDPGPMDENGDRAPGEQGENYPVLIPDDQGAVDKSCFEGEYAWQFVIDEAFDTELKVPMMDLAFMANYHVILDARKGGGNTAMGEYSGTMKLEMAIDEESFLSALKSLGDVPVDQMDSAIQTQTIDVKFTVIPFDSDTINQSKNEFLPKGGAPIVQLVHIPAMVISSAKTSTSGSVVLQGEEAYGNGTISGNGEIPFVIEVRANGDAKLYLPRMLSMCNRNWFDGTLVKLGIVNLP